MFASRKKTVCSKDLKELVKNIDQSTLDLLYHHDVITPQQYDLIVGSPSHHREKHLLRAIGRSKCKHAATVLQANVDESMNPQSYQFCLYPSPFYRRLSRSSQLTQSLARVWGLTKESDSRGTNYCVVIRDDVLFQIQLDSSSSISQDEVIRVRKGVSSVSSVHFDRIQVDEDKCGEAGKRRVLLMRAPGQVALTVLTAFSTFSKQLEFELKLRHFLPPHLFIVFCLGSLRPIPLKLITGVSRMEIVEKTHWIDIQYMKEDVV